MAPLRLPTPIENALEWLRGDRRAQWAAAGLGGLAIAALAWAVAAGPLAGGDGAGGDRVVTVSFETDDAATAPVGPLGYPLVATRNTTRVGGIDPATDAAAIALATHPPAPNAPPVEAAVIVGSEDWQAGIAASVLAGPPVRAPILIGEPDSVPDVTADALATLDPRGGSGPSDAAVYAVGAVASPPGFETERIAGGSPAEVADAIDVLRGRLLGADPAHLLVASSEQAPYAMPAAGWAARSGDPVLFAERERLPEATARALRRHPETPVYVLGPEDVIGPEVVREIERISAGVERIGDPGASANSVAFARYAGSGFGWNINDPGHGLVLASATRPLDAAAAAPLSASSRWGPLLLVEDTDRLPADVRSFLLDIKPGFEDDPTRALYNHVWVIGDSSAVGAEVQAEVDELAELTEVGPGAGGPVIEGGETGDQP